MAMAEEWPAIAILHDCCPLFDLVAQRLRPARRNESVHSATVEKITALQVAALYSTPTRVVKFDWQLN